MADTASTAPKSYSADPTLYLYTSLTAGSSHIITATSRLETILKANKIPFRALDVATDEKARMLWGRRSKGKKLPGLVKFGTIDLEEVEEWNEYGELKQQIGGVPSLAAAPAKATPAPAPSTAPARAPSPASTSPHIQIREPAGSGEERRRSHEASMSSAAQKEDSPLTMAMRQAGAEAAKKAEGRKTSMPPAPSTKEAGIAKLPEPVVDTRLGKASEDPTTSSETTAGKAPGTLAAEGAKRSSVDKIAEANDSAGTQSAVSTPETLLQLRRSSSITKTKSPLSEETPAAAAPSWSEQLEKKPLMHRGSNVSNASKEEIESIEKAQAIPEASDEASEKSEAEPETSAGKSNLTSVTSSDEAEKAGNDSIKPQGQGAKDVDAAGVSVGD